MWQRMEKFYFIQQIYRMMRELPLPSLRKMEDTKPWKRLRKDLQIESKPKSGDYFLRLPCKVGSNIYRITDDGVEVAVCREMTVADKEMYIESVTLYDWISFDEIGKSVFLTREEAEAKLKEMEEKDGR